MFLQNTTNDFLLECFWSSAWTFEFSLLKNVDVRYRLAAPPQRRLTDISALSDLQITCRHLHIQTEMSRETVQPLNLFAEFLYIIPRSFYHILFQSSAGISLGCHSDCWIPANTVHLQWVMVELHQPISVCVTTELLLYCWSCSAELSPVCYSSASLAEAGSSL